MKMSELDVIGQELKLLENRKTATGGFWSRSINAILYPRYPKHTFTFFTPEYLFIRSVSLCEEITEEYEEKFTTNDLATCIYQDFLAHCRSKNDLNGVYKKLTLRDLAFPKVKPYQSEDSYEGVLFDEVRGFQEMKVTLPHKEALRGEYILRDLLDLQPDHEFTLEMVLGIIYSNFIDDYRKGLIKNPIDKILQYV